MFFNMHGLLFFAYVPWHCIIKIRQLNNPIKTATDALKEHIFSNMSERAADMVQDDLDALGPVRVADVDMASIAAFPADRCQL